MQTLSQNNKMLVSMSNLNMIKRSPIYFKVTKETELPPRDQGERSSILQQRNLSKVSTLTFF